MDVSDYTGITARESPKAGQGCPGLWLLIPRGSPTSLLRGCPAHAELPETFPTHNTNQCYHLLFCSSGNDATTTTAPPTTATPTTTGKEQKPSVSPFRGQIGVTQSQGALQPPQAGTSAPARFSLSSSPRGDRGAQIKAVTALHSPLFPCWPLLQGESVGEDLKRVLFSCLVPLPPAPVPGARGSLQLRCPGQGRDRAEQGVVAAAVWSTGREGAGAHASMGLSGRGRGRGPRSGPSQESSIAGRAPCPSVVLGGPMQVGRSCCWSHAEEGKPAHPLSSSSTVGSDERILPASTPLSHHACPPSGKTGCLTLSPG